MNQIPGVSPIIGQYDCSNGLYDDLTALENVTFWASTVGAGRDDVDAAMAAMEISDRLHDVRVRHLSAGQRRRVALAGLVARRCELWLLDEPTLGLALAVVADLFQCLAALARSGTAVVLAEQRAAESELENVHQQQGDATEQFNEVQGELYAVGSDIARLEQTIRHARELQARQRREHGEVSASLQDLEIGRAHV